MIKLLVFLIVLSACSNGSSSYELIALEIIENNPNKDIFMIEDKVYTISESDEMYHYENDEVSALGEITKVYSGGKRFENGMATKLTTGTLIYESNTYSTGGYLYIKVNDQYLRYILEVEG